MPPATFVSRLRAALDPSMGHTSDDIQSFLDSLSNMGFERAVARANKIVAEEDQEELHCVRCRKAYLGGENGMEACVGPRERSFTPGRPSSNSGDVFQGRRVSCDQATPNGTVALYSCITGRQAAKYDGIRGVEDGLVRSCENEYGSQAQRVVGACLGMEVQSLKIAPSRGDSDENTAQSSDYSSIFQVEEPHPMVSNAKPGRPMKSLPRQSPTKASTTAAATETPTTTNALATSGTKHPSASQKSSSPNSNPVPGAKDFKFDREAFQAILNCKAEGRDYALLKLEDRRRTDERGNAKKAGGERVGTGGNTPMRQRKNHGQGFAGGKVQEERKPSAQDASEGSPMKGTSEPRLDSDKNGQQLGHYDLRCEKHPELLARSPQSRCPYCA